MLSWASVPLFLRALSVEHHLDPFSANGWRYAISALFWLPFLIVARRRGNLPNALLKAALIPTAFNILGQTTFALGPALLEPGFFSFVFRVQIIFVTLGAYLLFPTERSTLRSPRFWIGIALVVMGSSGLILFKPTTNVTVSSGVGIAVALTSGVLFAGYGLSVRKFVSSYSPIVSFGVICQFTAIGMLSIAAIMPSVGSSLVPKGLPPLDFTKPLTSFGPWAWTLLISSAFIGIAISHVTYYASIRKLGVSLSMGIIQLQPIFTAVGSAIIFREQLSPEQWIAGIVGVCGAVLMLSAGKHKPREAPETQEEH